MNPSDFRISRGDITSFPTDGLPYYTRWVSGFNDAVTAGEDVWNPGGALSFISALEKIKITSSTGNDAAAGSGAQKVVVEGIENAAGYPRAVASITPTGMTKAVSNESFIRVNRVWASQVGSGLYADGNITCAGNTSGDTQGIIAAGTNQARNCIYSLGGAETGFIRGVYAALGTSNGQTISVAEAHLQLQVNTGFTATNLAFFPIWESRLRSGGGPSWMPFDPPLMVDPQADIRMRAIAVDGSDIAVAAAFQLIVVTKI